MAETGKTKPMQVPTFGGASSAAGSASSAAGASGAVDYVTTKPMQVTGNVDYGTTKPFSVAQPTTPAPAPAAVNPSTGMQSPQYRFRYEDGSEGDSPWQKDASGNYLLTPGGGVRDGTLIGSNSPNGYAGAAMAGAGDQWLQANGRTYETLYGGPPAGSTAAAPTSGAIPMPKPTPVGGNPTGPGGVGASFGGGGFGASAVPGAVSDTSRQRVEQALLSRLEPQFQQDEARMRNQLLSSGLEVGSPAYTAELQRLQQSQNDARMQSVLAGGNEESRQVGLNAQLQNQAFGQGLSGAQFDNATQAQLFQQYMQGAQFDNQTRQQMLAELLLQRNTPLNELNALRTGSQVSMPNFGNYYTSNSQAAPMFDAATAQGNYNANAAASAQSGTNALIGGAATAAAAFF